jgi:hypothetical protein
MRAAMRAAYLTIYGLFAALGAALLAHPALVQARGLGLFGPVLPWDVPWGPGALVLFAALAVFTLGLAVSVALGRKPRVPEHAVFLALLGAAVAVRTGAGDPVPPPDPAPALINALRAAADAADVQYAQRGGYQLNEGPLDAALSKISPPGFRYRLRELPLRTRVIPRATGPQLAPELGDQPGTILIAVSNDSSRCWLTALTLRAGRVAVLTSADRPVLLQARAGTHGAPGRDPMVPAYPTMRAVGRSVR